MADNNSSAVYIITTILFSLIICHCLASLWMYLLFLYLTV